MEGHTIIEICVFLWKSIIMGSNHLLSLLNFAIKPRRALVVYVYYAAIKQSGGVVVVVADCLGQVRKRLDSLLFYSPTSGPRRDRYIVDTSLTFISKVMPGTRWYLYREAGV